MLRHSGYVYASLVLFFLTVMVFPAHPICGADTPAPDPNALTAKEVIALKEAEVACARADQIAAGLESNCRPNYTDANVYLNMDALASLLKSGKDDDIFGKLAKYTTAFTGVDKPDLKTQLGILIKSNDRLKAALSGVPVGMKTCIGKCIDDLAPFAKPARDANDTRLKLVKLLPVLQRTATALPQLRTHWSDVRVKWQALQPANSGATAESATLVLAGVDNAMGTAINNAMDVAVNSTGAWMGAMSSDLKRRSATDTNALSELIKQQILYSGATAVANAMVYLKDDTEVLGEIDAIYAAWPAIQVSLNNVDTLDDDAVRETGIRAQAMHEDVEQLRAMLGLLQDGLAGDQSKFDGDHVSLYYFTDVERLMKTLNSLTREVGGVTGVKEQALETKRKLVNAELALTNAQAAVNAIQPRLINMPREMSDAQRALTRAESAYTKATRYNEDITKKKDVSEEVTTQAARDMSDRLAEKNQAQDKVNKLTGEQQQITSLQTQLVQAQQEVVRCRVNCALLAQDELTAFAEARDNAPFLFAPAQAISTDAAKRVLMYAYRDSKTIFLRGNKDDVKRVKDLIAKFDAPVPQARLTLWTLEMNCLQDSFSVGQFDKALTLVDQDLAKTRISIAAATELLRMCVNEAVNNAAQYNDNTDPYYARLAFYNPEVVRKMGLPSYAKNASPSTGELTLLKGNLPDPAGTTTIGEALMVLSLATQNNREKVMTNFEARMNAIFGRPPGKRSVRSPFKTESIWFPSLRIALGLTTTASAVPEPLTQQQLEIVRAMQAAALLRLSEKVSEYADQLNLYVDDLKKLQTKLQTYRDSRNAIGVVGIKEQIAELVSTIQVETINKISASYMQINRWIDQEFNSGYKGIDSYFSDITLTNNSDPWDAGLIDIDKILYRVSRIKPRLEFNATNRAAQARTAAADQMLKELITAMDEDVERHFITPMFITMRKELRDRQINVGILQRSSMLASNRTLARVNPRSSAQMEMGDEVNALHDVVQLADLYAAAQTGNLVNSLKGLRELKDDTKAQELYGITTGGEFKVTPVIDPSGQALRFRFDYLAQSQVREPEGTVNPQLPRIERHAVNTEVQLSNLELRNIAQFDANSKLGLPWRTSGGLPVFKDIPGVKWLPIIGWFSLQKGKAASSQQSLIFAQATIYPTITSITDLLASPIELGGTGDDGTAKTDSSDKTTSSQ